MKKVIKTTISFALAGSLAFWGISPALADEEADLGDNADSTSTSVNPENDESDNTTDFQDNALSLSSYKPLDTTITLDTIDDAIKKEYTSRITALCSEGEELLEEIETYDDYLNDYFGDKNKVENFYKKVVAETNILCITLRDYAAYYVELIMNSDLSDKEQTAAIERLNTLIYEDAYKAINDNIYNGLLDDFNDQFLNGFLETMPKDAWADEYAYMKADEAMWLQNAYDDVYYINHKTRKAVEHLLKEGQKYITFGVSVRMTNVLADFKEALEDLKFHSGLITEVTIKTPATKEERAEVKDYLAKWDDEAAKKHEENPYTEESYKAFTEASRKALVICNAKSSSLEDIQAAQKAYDDAWYALTPISTAPKESASPASDNTPSPSFKETMDAYEAFFDEYITFMQTYTESDNTLSMLTDLANMMTRYTETMESLNSIDTNSLSTADELYYIEVMTRINAKLASASLG